ncbi:MAG: Imm30 family immunity protein [Microcoleaceae cyanobacterium]
MERCSSSLSFIAQFTNAHLIFDDKCQHPEVMFGLVHFLESIEVEKQLEAFMKVIPQLMIDAPEWTRVLHERILNDKLACDTYQKLLQTVNRQLPHFIYYLLEESVESHLNKESSNVSVVK